MTSDPPSYTRRVVSEISLFVSLRFVSVYSLVCIFFGPPPVKTGPRFIPDGMET